MKIQLCSKCSARETLTVSSVSAVTAFSLFWTLLFVIFCNALTLQTCLTIVGLSQHFFASDPEVQLEFGATPLDALDQLLGSPRAWGRVWQIHPVPSCIFLNVLGKSSQDAARLQPLTYQIDLRLHAVETALWHVPRQPESFFTRKKLRF